MQLAGRRFSATYQDNEARAYCRAVLPRVSRTFALNIRILPPPLRDAVSQAYLFCRIADTVEDTAYMSLALKDHVLDEYSNLFPVRRDWSTRAVRWSRHFDKLEDAGPDHSLARRVSLVFTAFHSLDAAWRAPVETCVREMSIGMRSFVRRGTGAGSQLHLESVAELQEYCHYVAGTVGIMLCRLFSLHSPKLRGRRLEKMMRLAEPFGLALQMTNILKDVARDDGRGVVYLPREIVAKHALEASDLIAGRDPGRAQQVFDEAVALVRPALESALEFTLLIPWHELRLRLFCLWPLFLALRTLRHLRQTAPVFSRRGSHRISRGELRRCLLETSLAACSDRALRRIFARENRALLAAESF